MQVRKLGVKALTVGKIYIAYSAKNKLLSKNGDSGVLVKLDSVAGVNIKVRVLGTNTVTTIAKLEERDDAWIYDPAGCEVQVCARIADKKAWPGFSPRMEREGWDGKAFTFDEEEIYEVTAEDSEEHAGKTLIRHQGDTIDPEEGEAYYNTFLLSDIYPVSPPEWRIPRALRMGVGAVEVALPPKRVSAEDGEVLALLSDALKTFNERKNLGATATLCIVNEKGVITDTEWSGACHAALCRASKGGKYIISGCKPAKEDFYNEAELAFYINYLTGYSPFADAFIIKDAEWIKENGYVLSGDVSAQMLAGACIATRQAWEYPGMVKAFNGLAEQGIPNNAAFFFGCKATVSGKLWKFTQSNTGHTVFAHERMPEKAIINFLDGKPAKQNKDPYVKNVSYDGVNAMWSADGLKQQKLPVFVKLEELGGKAAAWGKSGLQFDEAMEQAADIIDEWAAAAGV